MKCNFTIESKNLALVILCTCALMQNVIVGGANNAILTTIERAFYMTSFESAMFLASYDVANIIASPIIGYFGDSTAAKHRIIALSMFGLTSANLVMTVPAIVNMNNIDDNNTEVYSNDTGTKIQVDQATCVRTSLTTTVNPPLRNVTQHTQRTRSHDPALKGIRYLFFVANMINGVSSVALYTIVITYLEGMFVAEKVHLRQGIYYATGAIGVGIGMLATGNFLNVNGRRLSKRNMNHNSVNFIGAWWIIYIVGASIDLILGLMLLHFSPDMSSRKTYRDVAQTNAPSSGNPTLQAKTLNDSGIFDEFVNASCKPVSSDTLPVIGETNSLPSMELAVSVTSEPPVECKAPFSYHLREFARHALIILSNRVFLFIIVCTTCETFLVKGFSSYLGKYLEYQYRLPASTATMITGAIGFVSLVGGVLLGSLLIKRYNWHIFQCCKFVTIVLFITSVLFLGLLIHCPQEEYFGSDHPLVKTLSANCACDDNNFYPICYKKIYIFQTPCHAGCEHSVRSNAYTKCAVLNKLLHSYTSNEVEACDRPASHCMVHLIVVICFGLAFLFLSSIVALPLLRVILDSVSSNNQSFALGIKSFITKSFGNIPGPIVFATVVDRSCIEWIWSNGNKTCRLYNNAAFSMGLGSLGASIRFVSATFALVTLYFIRKQGTLQISLPSDVASVTQTSASSSRSLRHGQVNRGFDVDADGMDSIRYQPYDH